MILKKIFNFDLMKKLIVFLLIIGFVSKELIAQTWRYEAGEDAFDGKYKTSSIIGIGTEWPYVNPIFVINIFRNDPEHANIYLSKVPYAGCDNNYTVIKFDNSEKLFTPLVTTNRANDIWFLDFQKYKAKFIDNEWVFEPIGNDENMFKEFIKMLRSHSKIHIRLQSDCLKYDCVFNLNGSNEALNFIFK
jgi:hypothetical protein